MSEAARAEFLELDQPEIEAILARNHVGRLAFTFRDKVDIEPLSYVYADGVINFRTAPGTKLEVLLHQPSVAFEVDEVRGHYEWKSVVVHGTVYMAEPEGSRYDVDAHEQAVAAIRGVAPQALGPDDPAPFRTVLLRLHIFRMEGREARLV
jgi:nitroimidazol reductase NimA-like FMN-containing flavoprotein (pyridoxamine 5'-phosphate oxidase superfamily)